MDAELADAPMQGKATPLQPRALRTRASLLDAVETLAAAEGADAVTTTRLAFLSGVAVGTIYRYFADRDALLLAAYDATVTRIVRDCAAQFDRFDRTTPMDAAARQLLGIYLDTADTIPAHAPLLKAMRAIRPIEADQRGGNETAIIDRLLAPFWERYAPAAAPDPAGLHFLSVLLGTLVDLYLVTEGPERQRLRGEIEAHMLLALERTLQSRG